MFLTTRRIVITKRKIVVALLLAAGVGLVASLLLYLVEGEDEALSKVLKLDGRGRNVVWSPDGKTLAVVTIYEPLLFRKRGSAVNLWDIDKGEVRAPLAESMQPGLAFQHVAFSFDGKTIASTVTEGPQINQPISRPVIEDVLKLWDAKTLVLKQTLGLGDLSHLACSAFARDGKLVAAGDPSKKIIKLWNAETGSQERILDTGEAQPLSIAFSPDGKTLLVGGQKDDRNFESRHEVNLVSGQLQWWDTQTWTRKRVVKLDQYVNTVALSANGKLLASGGGSNLIQLWDAQTGELIHSLQGLASGTRSVAISPDSKTVAAGGKDGKVRLWDAETGKLKATLKAPGWGLPAASEIYSVAFSPDGKTLASASQDKTVRLWRMPARVVEK